MFVPHLHLAIAISNLHRHYTHWQGVIVGFSLKSMKIGQKLGKNYFVVASCF